MGKRLQRRCSDLSLTRVLTCTLTYGPTWGSSTSIWMPVPSQHCGLRGANLLRAVCGERTACCPTNSLHLPLALPPLDTLMRENLPGEGAISERCVDDLCPARWKPPDLPHGEGAATERRAAKARCTKPLKAPGEHGKDLQESGGATSTGQLTCIPWKCRPFRTCRHGQERRCRGSRTLMGRRA